MATVTSLNIGDTSMSYGKPNGLHWITATFFLIADMAGAGLVALPAAMTRSGSFSGIIIMILIAVTFCYTACVLSENWIIMCNRWTVYAKHCRKPYPEMAYRAMGSSARSACSSILNMVFFGVAVVFCLLASYIINDFIVSITGYDIGFCWVLLLAVIAIYPVTLLRSPQDFWWAVVLAMLTTLFAVILILIGSWLDYGKCGDTVADVKPIIHFDGIVASLGTYIFGFGGHIVFPSVQHDMKHPKHFTRCAILAYAVVAGIYLPVSILGYATYGNSLYDSVINSIQTGWIRYTANLFIAMHCILTLTVVINPLNQEVESLFKAPHHFGWHRVVIRTVVILAVLFVAETVPKFGPILNVIGGSTVALTSAVLPLIYNNYLIASVHDPVTNVYERSTFIQVIQRNSKRKLIIDFLVVVISTFFSIATTYVAVVDMVSTDFTMPCYLSFLKTVPQNTSVETLSQQSAVCSLT